MKLFRKSSDKTAEHFFTAYAVFTTLMLGCLALPRAGIGEEKPLRSKIMPTDSDILPRVLKQRGYAATDTFKALVIEIVPDETSGFVFYPMDFAGTSTPRPPRWSGFTRGDSTRRKPMSPTTMKMKEAL